MGFWSAYRTRKSSSMIEWLSKTFGISRKSDNDTAFSVNLYWPAIVICYIQWDKILSNNVELCQKWLHYQQLHLDKAVACQIEESYSFRSWIRIRFLIPILALRIILWFNFPLKVMNNEDVQWFFKIPLLNNQ